MDGEIRRIVTGHDAQGRAIVLYDGPSPTKMVRAETGLVSRLMWVTDETPADLAGASREDRAVRKIGIPPPPNGSILRVVDFPPTGDVSRLPLDHLARELGEGHAPSKFPPRHPAMHRTRSIDYAIVLVGEIDMLLDDSEVRVKAGDIVIQQGTNHAWVNRGDKPCRIAFILIDAKLP
jgi:mannose-6-phosphate isomerase-like protein (cupin superfamily)